MKHFCWLRQGSRRGRGVPRTSHCFLLPRLKPQASWDLPDPAVQQASLPQWMSAVHLSLPREAVLTTVWQVGSLARHGTSSNTRKASLGDRTQIRDFNGAGLSMFVCRSDNKLLKSFLLLSPNASPCSLLPSDSSSALEASSDKDGPSESRGSSAHLVFLSWASMSPALPMVSRISHEHIVPSLPCEISTPPAEASSKSTRG